MSKRKPKPWKKVLYEKQPYPDNYTDPGMFLQDLKKNVHLREVSFSEACLGANYLLQEFCIVVLFVNVYFYIINQRVEGQKVLYIATSINLLGFIHYRLWCSNFLSASSRQHFLGYEIRTVLTFIAFGQLFSPVLHTLTDTISTDTIYTMTFLMLLVYLIFYDYGVSAAVVSKSLSTSAAVFASICLASRLSSAFDAFVLLTVATDLFVLSPILRRQLKSPLALSLILLVLNFYLTYSISIIMTGLFVSGVVLINVLCPLLFVKYQKYKDNIYGPWDEAVVKDIDKMTFLLEDSKSRHVSHL